jgi:hypothetical protein
MPYIDKENELVGVTNCTALQNGWVWNIPLWSKIGTGYVYSNKFVSDEDALLEFKEHLRKAGRDPELLDYRKIPMKTGIHERLWVKNVVALGLAAGFIEPLESTGLWFTHEFASMLLRILYRSVPPSQHDRDIFNHMAKENWTQLVSFIGKHYALSSRRDSPYWKSIAETSFEMDEKFVYATFNDGARWYSKWPGMNCIAHGMEHHFYDDITYWKSVHPKNQDWKSIYAMDFAILDKARTEWNNEADTAKTLFEVLTEIHGRNSDPNVKS